RGESRERSGRAVSERPALPGVRSRTSSTAHECHLDRSEPINKEGPLLLDLCSNLPSLRPHAEAAWLLMRARREVAKDPLLVVRHFPRDVHVLLLPEHVQGDRLSSIVGAQNAHGLLGRRGLPAAN